MTKPRNTEVVKDNRAAVALRKRSAPGVGENTVKPTALSRALNVTIARGRVTLHVNAGRRVRVVHHVDEGETPVRQHSGEYLILHVTAGRTAPLYATVNVNGQPISMEIDTGASVSITS